MAGRGREKWQKGCLSVASTSHRLQSLTVEEGVGVCTTGSTLQRRQSSAALRSEPGQQLQAAAGLTSNRDAFCAKSSVHRIGRSLASAGAVSCYYLRVPSARHAHQLLCFSASCLSSPRRREAARAHTRTPHNCWTHLQRACAAETIEPSFAQRHLLFFPRKRKRISSAALTTVARAHCTLGRRDNTLRAPLAPGCRGARLAPLPRKQAKREQHRARHHATTASTAARGDRHHRESLRLRRL